MSTRKDLIEVRPCWFGKRVRLVHADGRRFTIRQRKNYIEIREFHLDDRTVSVYFTYSNVHSDEFAQQLGLALS